MLQQCWVGERARDFVVFLAGLLVGIAMLVLEAGRIICLAIFNLLIWLAHFDERVMKAFTKINMCTGCFRVSSPD